MPAHSRKRREERRRKKTQCGQQVDHLYLSLFVMKFGSYLSKEKKGKKEE